MSLTDIKQQLIDQIQASNDESLMEELLGDITTTYRLFIYDRTTSSFARAH